jgi:hypothetical protein
MLGSSQKTLQQTAHNKDENVELGVTLLDKV